MGLKTRWLRTAIVRGQGMVRVSGWSMAVNDRRRLCTAVGFRQSQIDLTLLSSMGYNWISLMMRLFERSTSVCIQITRSRDRRTPSRLRFVAASLRGTKASWEHNRIPSGEGTAIWAVACYLSSRRLFPLNRLNPKSGSSHDSFAIMANSEVIREVPVKSPFEVRHAAPSSTPVTRHAQTCFGHSASILPGFTRRPRGQVSNLPITPFSRRFGV